MRILFTLFSVIFFCTSQIAFSAGTISMSYPVPTAGIEVTSPYGWRIHPITGDPKYHSGVDFGVDFETPITAAEDGQVIYASDLGGYGNTIILSHERLLSSLTTLYAHNQSLLVGEGDMVRRGQVIALAGSTGNSTGPHCHFEVCIDDEPQDPALFLPGLRSLYHGDASGVAPQDEHGSYIDFDLSIDFGKEIRAFIHSFVDTVTSAISRIKDSVHHLFLLLLVIDFVLAIVTRTLAEQTNEDFPNWAVSRFLLYGVLIGLWANWDTVANFAMHGFPSLGAMAIGSTPQEAAAILSDPTAIMQKGMKLIEPLINDTLHINSVLTALQFPQTCLVSIFFTIAFFVLFAVIGFQILKAYLEFYMVILFSFVNFMMASNKHVRKYASRGLNGVFAVSINLMFFCIFAVMLQFTMQNIVVESFTIRTTEEGRTQSVGRVGEIKNLQDCMERIRRVESYGGNYHCDNGLGFYGAYQINKTYWDRWSDDYIANRVETSPALDTDENYTRWTETGPLDTGPEPTNTKWPWSPHNQDIVAGYILTGYFQRYHSWEAACRAWNQGEGGMENAEAYEYQAKCLDKKASSQSYRTVLNYKVLLLLLVVILIFMYFADRMSKRIITQFGGMGFKLTNEE